MESEIDYKQLAEDLQAEVERLHIRIAKGWNRPTFDFLGVVGVQWSKLSYVEKVYTIALFIIAGCAVATMIRDLYRE